MKEDRNKKDDIELIEIKYDFPTESIPDIKTAPEEEIEEWLDGLFMPEEYKDDMRKQIQELRDTTSEDQS